MNCQNDLSRPSPSPVIIDRKKSIPPCDAIQIRTLVSSDEELPGIEPSPTAASKIRPGRHILNNDNDDQQDGYQPKCVSKKRKNPPLNKNKQQY